MNKLLNCITACLLLPLFANAQDVRHTDTRPGTIGINLELFKNGSLGERGPVYVNEKAPGVHKEYDEKYGTTVWKDGMGNYLCKDENMKPIHEIDAGVFYNGDENSPWVKKVWDSERNCYVWRSNNGDFLGRDKPTDKQTEKWVKDQQKNWLSEGKTPKGKDKMSEKAKFAQNAVKKAVTSVSKEKVKQIDEAMNKAGEEYDKITIDAETAEMLRKAGIDPDNCTQEDIDRILRQTDQQVREAEAGLAEARRALREAGMEGEYGDLLNQAQGSLNQYKNIRNKVRK